MGKEWKNRWHNVLMIQATLACIIRYVVPMIFPLFSHFVSFATLCHVHELDDEEFNDLLESGSFVYDASRNPFDQGCLVNCWTFWCQARWTADAKGEF